MNGNCDAKTFIAMDQALDEFLQQVGYFVLK